MLATIGLVAVVAAGAAAHNWLQVEEIARQQSDRYGIAMAIRRFQPVLEKLPAGPVGYITDVDVKSTAGQTAFMAAQYAVAPAMLAIPTDTVKPQFAIGNFSRPQDFEAVGRAAGYRMLHDYGTGVILFERIAR